MIGHHFLLEFSIYHTGRHTESTTIELYTIGVSNTNLDYYIPIGYNLVVLWKFAAKKEKSVTDCIGILLSSGACVTEADVRELYTLAKTNKPSLSPAKASIPMLADDDEEAISQIFPTFPVSKKYLTLDTLRNLRRRWYKEQGFYWNGALALLSPLWLLTADEIEVRARRNVGDELWNRIVSWREENKDKIELLK